MTSCLGILLISLTPGRWFVRQQIGYELW